MKDYKPYRYAKSDGPTNEIGQRCHGVTRARYSVRRVDNVSMGVLRFRIRGDSHFEIPENKTAIRERAGRAKIFIVGPRANRVMIGCKTSIGNRRRNPQL